MKGLEIGHERFKNASYNPTPMIILFVTHFTLHSIKRKILELRNGIVHVHFKICVTSLKLLLNVGLNVVGLNISDYLDLKNYFSYTSNKYL
jgi:hypothetical protein